MSALVDLAKIYQSRRVARDVISGLREPIRFEECWWWDISRIEEADESRAQAGDTCAPIFEKVIP